MPVRRFAGGEVLVTVAGGGDSGGKRRKKPRKSVILLTNSIFVVVLAAFWIFPLVYSWDAWRTRTYVQTSLWLAVLIPLFLWWKMGVRLRFAAGLVVAALVVTLGVPWVMATCRYRVPGVEVSGSDAAVEMIRDFPRLVQGSGDLVFLVSDDGVVGVHPDGTAWSRTVDDMGPEVQRVSESWLVRADRLLIRSVPMQPDSGYALVLLDDGGDVVWSSGQVDSEARAVAASDDTFVVSGLGDAGPIWTGRSLVDGSLRWEMTARWARGVESVVPPGPGAKLPGRFFTGAEDGTQHARDPATGEVVATVPDAPTWAVDELLVTVTPGEPCSVQIAGGPAPVRGTIDCAVLDTYAKATVVGDVLCLPTGTSNIALHMPSAASSADLHCTDAPTTTSVTGGTVVVHDQSGRELWRHSGFDHPDARQVGAVVAVTSEGHDQPFGPRHYQWLAVYDAQSGARLASAPVHRILAIDDHRALVVAAGTNGRSSIRLVTYE